MKHICTAIIVLLIGMGSAIAQPKTLPHFVLPDPGGTQHAASTLVAKSGMVLVVTAPTYHAGDAQKGWDNVLVATMPKGGSLVFIEDMSVSDWKSVARADMKKDWKPGVPPLLLLDEKGYVRSELGVGADATVVLVYNKKGALVFTDRGGPSMASAKAIWGKLK